MGLWGKIQRHMAPPYQGKTIKEALYIMIFQSNTKLGVIFNVVLILFILASITNVMLESLQIFDERHYRLLHNCEYGFTLFFTIEYILRIYCSPQPRKYIFSFFGIIDLLAILPIYLSLVIPGSSYLIVMRAFRLIRIFRIFKLFQFLKEGDVLLYSIRMSLPKIIVFFCFVVILVISIGTIMYVVEGSQPNTAFKNIPVSIYWAIVTMTTVGYGDITPVTPLGRFLSAFVMLVGYTIIAVPTGIVTASMVKHASEKGGRDTKKKCHACGRDTNDQSAFYCKYCGSPLDPSQTVTLSKRKPST